MEARATLALDNTPFAQAIDQAEKKAESFSSKVRRLFGGGGGKSPWEEFIAPIPKANQALDGFQGRLTGLFKRDPTQRAENALSNFVSSLAVGDVPGAITGLTTRITAFGLAAGVAIGASVALFQRFKGQVDEATESERKLNAELATMGGVRGPEEATKKLEALASTVDDFAKKSSTLGAKVGGFAKDFFAPATLDFGRKIGDSAKEVSEKIQAGAKAEVKLLANRALAEQALLSLKNQSIKGSEREAALNKAAYDASIKRTAVEEEASKFRETLLHPPKELEGKIPTDVRDKLIKASDEAAKSRIQAIIDEEKLNSAEINKQFDIKKSEADIESKILELKRQGVSEEARTTAETRLRIALLRQQLGLVSAEQQAAIQNKISALKQQLGPDNRAPIGISGEQPLGIYDPNTGEFRNTLRPQEQANLRAGQAEAMARLRDDQSQYASDLTGWQSRYQDYLRGADYYTPDQLKRPPAPTGYDVDVRTGQVTPRPREGAGPAKPLTKEEMQSAFDAVMSKYWGN